MGNTKILFFLLITAALLLTSGCGNAAPKGLVDAVTMAAAGSVLGCPTNKCEGAGGELPITISSTQQQLDARFETLKKYWCETYILTTQRIPRNQEGKFSGTRSYSLKVTGFGSVKATVEDFSANVKALDDGWKTIVDHPAHLSSKQPLAKCPKEWAQMKCTVRPAVKVSSGGEVALSWMAGAETKMAEAGVGEEINFTPATAVSWCNMQNHATVAAKQECPTPESSTGTHGGEPGQD